MHELIFSESASNDLISIVEYIASNSVERAYKYHDSILKQLSDLVKEPLIGMPSKNKRLKAKGYRFLIVESHIVHYQVDVKKSEIYIIRILHSAMNQLKHLK